MDPKRETRRVSRSGATEIYWERAGTSRKLDLSSHANIMGIVNVTPDSFSDGGQFADTDTAVEYALKLAEEGADVVDIGGESTRPGAEAIATDEELKRVVPVIERVRAASDMLISVDTCKAAVAEAALDAGADMVNDVTAMRSDEKMIPLVAERCCPAVLMHMLGTPRNMQRDPQYKDVVGDIEEFFSDRMKAAVRGGIDPSRIILDPGVGFGKTVEHNREILRRLGEFCALGRPVMVGASRKSVIGAVLELPVTERLEATLAITALSIAAGARIIRVHDVAANVRCARMTEAVIFSGTGKKA